MFVIPNGEYVRKWVPHRVLKLHNDPTVNKTEIITFLR